MQLRNDYDKNVFNGDVGLVASIDTEEIAMTLRFAAITASRSVEGNTCASVRPSSSAPTPSPWALTTIV